MFRSALRNVLAHKARLLMTVLAVMLGVAFVSGTLVFTDTLNQAFRNQTAKSYDDVAVGITSYVDASDPSQKSGLDEKTLDKIAAVDGVASVTGRVSGFAGVPDKDGKLIGAGWSNKGSNFAPAKDGKDRQYDFVQGEGPTAAGQVALDKDTADKGQYKVGDTVRVATEGPVREFTLQGVFTTDDGAVNAGGSLVLFDTATAQKQFSRPGYFQEATVIAASGADDKKILDAVKPLLPDNTEAQTGKELADKQAKDIEQGLGSLNQILLGFAAIALFVGVFLIANTFTMLVAQRTKEVALMRAVGASRGQITRSVLAEAFLVGLIASAAGLALGMGLAVGLRSAMNAFELKVPGGPLVVTATPVIAALTVGILITMLAAFLPGLRASRIAPVAAMNSAHAAPSQKSLLVRNIIGGSFAGLGALLIVMGAVQGSTMGRLLIAFGAFLTLLGVILLIPLLSRPVIALLRPLFVSVFGVSGKLAGLNAVRNPRRTGATASALAIGLTLVTGLSVLGVTVGASLEKMTTDQIKADYMVVTASQRPLDPSTVDALAKAPGVTAVSPQQDAYFEVKDDFVAAAGVNGADIDKLLKLEVVEGDLGSLAQGRIAITEKTAKDKDWKVGDSLPATFEDDKKAELTVGAVYKESDMLFGDVLIDTKVVEQHDPRPRVTAVYVNTDGGESAANEKALVDALGQNPALVVMDKQAIKDQFGGAINMMLNIMYGLLGMALLIAVLGVINTLAMSVFERQQEIGMLRAIGLDRRRVKRMIRLEAVVISLFGAIVGIVLGVFLGWAIGETIKGGLPDYSLVLPWDRIAVFLALAGLVGVLAAMWPARSAAKLNMLNAIKAE